MDPNVENANEKLEQAEQIDTTAADLRGDGNSDTAAELETTAENLRTEAETEMSEAQAAAEEEKANVDEKYGTT